MEEQLVYPAEKKRQSKRGYEFRGENSEFNSTNLVTYLYKKRKILIIVAIAAVVISSISALLIRDKYKSEVILFPTNTGSISKGLLSKTATGAKNDLLMFGEEEEAEQMLQVLNSDMIRSRIIEKYNLMDHYEIDPKSKYRNTLLHKEYESNISFKRTEFMSVKIEVLDHNPDTAALIANDIANLVDTVRNMMQRERAVQAFAIVKAEYDNTRAEIRAKEDSLRAIMELGIYDFESQSEMLYQQYAIALSRGNVKSQENLKEKLNIVSTYGPIYMSLRDHLEYERKHLVELKSKYDEAKVDAEQNITTKFIVSHAVPAEKKSYPIRWLIVVVSTLSALLLTVILLVMYDSVRRVDYA